MGGAFFWGKLFFQEFIQDSPLFSRSNFHSQEKWSHDLAHVRGRAHLPATHPGLCLWAGVPLPDFSTERSVGFGPGVSVVARVCLLSSSPWGEIKASPSVAKATLTGTRTDRWGSPLGHNGLLGTLAAGSQGDGEPRDLRELPWVTRERNWFVKPSLQPCPSPPLKHPLTLKQPNLSLTPQHPMESRSWKQSTAKP